MRYSDDDLRDMADDLPDIVGVDGDARSRLLCVMEILNTYTDEKRGLTAKEIAQVLMNRSDSGNLPSEPTVLADIHAIARNKPNGMEISIPEQGKSSGFKCTGRLISSDQARLLISIVNACKFISQKQCSELVKALNRLVSFNQQDQIAEGVYIDKAEREDNDNVFGAISVASECMREKKNIAFRYSYRGFDGRRRFLSNDEGGELFDETPIELVYSFGYYYLGTLRSPHEGGVVMMRRLDRMHDVRKAGPSPIDSKKIAGLKREIEGCVKHQFDMMGDGITRTVFLEVKKGPAVQIVYNRFGKACKFNQVSSDGEEAYVRLKAQLSPTFYRWIFGMGDMVEIVKPKSFLWATSGTWGKDSPSGEELMEDYKAARNGFVEMLDKVKGMYRD